MASLRKAFDLISLHSDDNMRELQEGRERKHGTKSGPLVWYSTPWHFYPGCWLTEKQFAAWSEYDQPKSDK